MRVVLLLGLMTAGALFLSGCASPQNSADGDAAAKLVAFRFIDANNDQFIARTSDDEVIAAARAQLALPRAKRTLHINGALARGHGGFNQPWSWHIVDNQWSLAEMSIGVCDGTAQHVEQNLEYWVDDVGRFCPWSSVVLAEY